MLDLFAELYYPAITLIEASKYMGAAEQFASFVTANPIIKGEYAVSFRLVVKVLGGAS